MSDKVVRIYTDGACSGNPGHTTPEAAMPRGRASSSPLDGDELIEPARAITGRDDV